MIWQLGIEKLDESVAFVWAGDDGELVAQDLEAVVPLLVNEAAFARWRCDKTVDRGAVGRGACRDRKSRAIGEGNAVEENDGRVERSEVTTKTCSDTTRVIGAECGYGADDDGLGGEDKSIVDVNGVDELRADRLADAHGEMIFDLDW